MFNKNQLHHFKFHQRQKLRCMECAAATEAVAKEQPEMHVPLPHAPAKVPPHDLETYQCEECLEKFSSLKFPKQVLAGVKKRKKPRLECRDCETRSGTANEVRQPQVLQAHTVRREETKEVPLDVPKLSDELR